MKKPTVFFVISILIGVALALPAYSQNSGSGMDHSGHIGAVVHESTIEGFSFAYHLIDLRKDADEMKDMEGAKEADQTHHLMVYVMDSQDRSVQDAKLGYLVEGPDGAKQKLMAMGMQGAYGANVDFLKKGVYTIKVKCVTGDKKLFDRFSYEVK
jgi:hypothetical protein